MLIASESAIRSVITGLLKLPRDVYSGNAHIPALLLLLQKDYTDAGNGILVALIRMDHLVLQPAKQFMFLRMAFMPGYQAILSSARRGQTMSPTPVSVRE